VLGEFPSSPGASIDLPARCYSRLSPLLHLRAALRRHSLLPGASPPGTITDELLTPELDPHRARREPKSRDMRSRVVRPRRRVHTSDAQLQIVDSIYRRCIAVTFTPVLIPDLVSRARALSLPLSYSIFVWWCRVASVAQ
jgi:hypothetical protein